MTGLSVTLRPDPISIDRVNCVMPAGLSLAEIVERWPGPMPEEFRVFGVVTVNGEMVPREMWAAVRPRADGPVPVVVGLHLLPQTGGGGGGRGKNIFALLGAIALIAATAWIGGGGLAFLGAGFQAGGIGASAAAALLGIAGSLILRALAPPPKPPKDRDKETVSAGVAFNTVAPLAGIPTVLGRLMVSPPQLVPPYTIFRNNVLYSHAIVGLAGRHLISDIKINDQEVGDLRGVTYQTRNGDPLEIVDAAGNSRTRLTLNAGTVLEESVAQEMSGFEYREDFYLVPRGDIKKSFPDWHKFKSRGAAEELRIRLLWAQGLVQEESQTDLDASAVYIRMQMRAEGAAAWTTLPTLYFSRKTFDQQRQEIRLIWRAPPDDKEIAGVEFVSGWHKNAFAEVFSTADTATTVNDETPYRANGYFRSGIPSPDAAYSFSEKPRRMRIIRDGFRIFLDPAVFPRGVHEVRIKRGAAVDPESSYNYPSYYFRATKDATGWRTPSNPERHTAPVFIESVTTLRNRYPLGFSSGFTLIALRANNLALQKINAVFTKQCPVYKDGTWTTIGSTRNPADLFRHILLDNLNAEPLPAALLDEANLKAWRNYCIANGLTCNALIESLSVEEALQLVAAAGHAAVRRSDKWGVIVEKSRLADAMVQVFSPRNTANNSVTRDFDQPVHGLRAGYLDEDDDYKVKEEVVYDDGYSAASASNIEAIEYPGKTDLAEVKLRARLDLRQLRLRGVRYLFETDSQFLVCQRGDLVGYTYDVLDRRSDAAWVKSVTRNGSNQVTALDLDADVFLDIPAGVWNSADPWSEANAWTATAYPGVLIRRKGGTVTSHRIAESSQTGRVTLVTPVAIADDEIIGALVVGGLLGKETRRCIVFDIEPRDDLTARVTLVDEAPGIHRLDTAAFAAGTIGAGLRLLEDGSYRLIEDGSHRLLQP